jgi:hypothetical protein
LHHADDARRARALERSVGKVVWGLIAVLAALAVAAVFVMTQGDRWVADAVETYGSAATKTAVGVRGVQLALTDGKATLDRLTIANPDGYATNYAVRIDAATVTLDLASLSTDVPVITEILLTGAHINAEQRGNATNLTELQRLISSPDDGAQDTTDGRIVIERFRLPAARVTVTSELIGEPELLTLEDVVVSGVGRGSGGATYSAAAEAILSPILAAARTAVQARLGQAAGEAVREELREELEDEAGGRLRDLLDR